MHISHSLPISHELISQHDGGSSAARKTSTGLFRFYCIPSLIIAAVTTIREVSSVPRFFQKFYIVWKCHIYGDRVQNSVSGRRNPHFNGDFAALSGPGILQ